MTLEQLNWKKKKKNRDRKMLSIKEKKREEKINSPRDRANAWKKNNNKKLHRKFDGKGEGRWTCAKRRLFKYIIARLKI